MKKGKLSTEKIIDYREIRQRVLKWFRVVPGCSGFSGMFRYVPGPVKLYVPGFSGYVPSMFRVVPGCSGLFRVCSGFKVVPGCSGLFRV